MKPPIAFLVLILFLLALSAGLGWLYSLLFSTGSAYPPYSSLRADPVGTRVLYESIASLDGRTVQRQYQQPWTLPPHEKPDAWLFLGAHPSDWKWLQPERASFLIETVRSGTTVAIALAPGRPDDEDDEPGKEEKPPPTPEDSAFDDFLAHLQRAVRLSTLLGLELDSIRQSEDTGRPRPAGVPSALRWRLRPLAPEWQTLAADEEGVLWAERAIGNGRLIFLADSFALSNEALAFERDAELLANLLGPAREIWFDEWHLGLVENPGIGTLLARYGLLPALATLLFAAALYAWRTASPLIPPATGAATAAPRQTREGFLSLMRRGIAPAALPETCWQAWKASMLNQPRHTDRRADQILEAEKLLGRNDLSPLQRFHQLNQLISKEKDLT